MSLSPLGLWLGLVLLGNGHSVTLVKRSLKDFPGAVCNDGTPASYFHPHQQYRPGQTVLLYLKGGGACSSIGACNLRCGSMSSPHPLCTTHPDSEITKTGTIWSEDQEENPAMYDSYKVYVPYCTSDLYTGRQDASEATGGWTFHGRIVLMAVINDLLKHLGPSAGLGQVLLMGSSAGAFGVAFNCDDVAERIGAEHPEADVRCLMDALDFSDPGLHIQGCDPYDRAHAPVVFWNSILDRTCEDYHPDSTVRACTLFASLQPFLETPFMLVIPYTDTNSAIHPCTPKLDEDPEFWKQWKEAIATMAVDMVERHPDSGLFVTNCPHHVSFSSPKIWGQMEVQVLDEANSLNLTYSEQSLTYKQGLANWLQGNRPYQALDTTDKLNPQC